MEIKIEGLDEIIQKLEDYEPFTRALGKDLGNIGVETASERIESLKADVTGKKWEQSKRAVKLGDPSRTLLDTGALLSSLGFELGRIKQGIVVLRADIEYSGFLQDGTKKMPARPFLGLSNEDINKAKEVLIKDFFKQTGLK